jgi:hypothetical protein
MGSLATIRAAKSATATGEHMRQWADWKSFFNFAVDNPAGPFLFGPDGGSHRPAPDETPSRR